MQIIAPHPEQEIDSDLERDRNGKQPRKWYHGMDPVVRFGHWALVVAFAIAYLSAEEEAGGPDVLHVWGGYAVGVIIILRVLWGFIGSRHARFSDFVGEVVSAPRYLVDLVRGRARRYLGHSPAGGAMIIALLVSLAATVATGVIAYGELGKGPLAVNGAGIVKQAVAEEDEDVRAVPKAGAKGEESMIGELHDSLANITLALIILHVLGVGLASFVHRENLLAAMITGRKRAEEYNRLVPRHASRADGREASDGDGVPSWLSAWSARSLFKWLCG